MHGFIKTFADGVFYPADILILTSAFDDAWARLQTSQAPFAAEAYAPAAREILAKHIIMVARTGGERDRRYLTEGALLHLSQQKLSRKPPA